MNRISLEEFERDIADFDAAVLVTPEIDRFCKEYELEA